MMRDPRRRRSPESSRRRPESRPDSRDREQERIIIDEPTASRSFASNPREETTFSKKSGGLTSSYYPSQQSHFASSSASFPVEGSPIVMRSSEPTPRPPSAMPIPSDLNRPRRVRRHGSRSSLDSSSASSSSSSSYLDISRWSPSWGRQGGVLKTFFKTPSEHRPRRRRSQRKMHNKGSKKTGGVFVFGGSNNSSSSSVDSDMAYGMGFIKKPKSRDGGFGVNTAAAAGSISGRERSEGRRGKQRRSSEEEILDIGRKLQDVARMQTRTDQDRRGKGSWESYQRQSSSGVDVSSRSLGLSKHGRRHHYSSSSDDEWESASEGEDSDGLSGLAYGYTPVPTPQPAKSSMSRMSTASAIAAGSALVAGSAIAASTAPDRRSTVVDPKLFGPTNSLPNFVNTPCGFNDDGGGTYHSNPGNPQSDAQGYADSGESASIEAKALQRVFPLQTSDPGHVEAARASGSVVSSQQNYSAIVRERVYFNDSVPNRPDSVPIQAPKPIAPVPSRIYNDERIRDVVSPEPVEHRHKPTRDNSMYAETALVGAGVAALGAAILAGRDKGKGKEDDLELKHGKHERYGHDDHRQDEAKVEDARKAQELRLMQEIERLEKALGKTNKVREQRRRDSKRDRESSSFVDAPADEYRKAEIDLDEERSYEGERDSRRLERPSKPGEPSDYNSRASQHSEGVAHDGDDSQHRRVGSSSQASGVAPVDVFQFQVPDDAFGTGNTPPKAPLPIIIDVTPSPSPAPEQRRESHRTSLAEETRDAHHIYEEAHHSTAPIPEVVMAAAIGAVAHSHRHQDEDEEGRGRTNARIADTIQEEANKFYAARRVAEREIRSRSRSKSHDSDSVVEAPRIVTPPEMQNRPPKNLFSGANADFRFDKEMSPTQLLGYWPEVAPVRDPSAERPRPVLNLVMPTPAPTPEPVRQRETAVVKEQEKEPEPVERSKEMPPVVFGPRGEVVEVEEVSEEPPTQPMSKRVSWGPSETKQYEEYSPERFHEHSPPSEKPKKDFGGWGAIAAAVTGAGVGAALANDRGPKSPKRDERNRDERSSGSRSPPKERPILSKDMSSRVLSEEPEELPPAPGPKPASPRNSQQMPGAFNDDIDFAATLAAGLEHSGFDPQIVIDNPEYHRRDSPPGSNEPYQQPAAETVSDLGIYNVDDGYSSLSHEHGYVIGEVNTPGSEKAALLDDLEDVSRGKSKKDNRSSSIYDDIEVIEEPEEAGLDVSRLSKKERRKLEKAAQASKIVENETQWETPQAVEAHDDEWVDSPTSKKTKKSKKAKRSSVTWNDAETPSKDTSVSSPIDAFDRAEDFVDDWDTPKQSRKSKNPKRDSEDYVPAGDGPPDKDKRDHRRTEIYEPIDRDVASVVSDSRYDDLSNGQSNGDDDRSVASAPSGSKRDSKRSSGGFWGLLGGKEQPQSKKDNAGTLGAGVGLAGVAAVAMAAAFGGSDAVGATSGHKQAEPHVDRDGPSEVEDEVFEDPEIAPRVIKPAIDPQYGDLLPLPPSPGETFLNFDDDDALPALPDSRPTTPPGQAPAVVRERESTMKRPTFASHARRPSTAEAPPRSPSHTAIPIQFRMGHRSMPATSSAIGNRSSPVVQSPPTPAQQESPPMFKRNEFSPMLKRQPPRPTSWDNSREIKPLYLLERSARPASEQEQRNELAEMTPLPPSRQSPVPEDQLEYEQGVGLGVDLTPLIIDTGADPSASYGSQEPTPTGLRPSEPLPSLLQEVETTPLEFPSSSSLPESSYATPGEFPREVESTSSQLEPVVSKAPDIKEVDKPERQSYFPSALSMLPAATLAGVGVLLGRGKKEEAHSSIPDVIESLPRSAEPAPVTETVMELPSETGLIEETGLAKSDFDSIAKSDERQEVYQSPPSKVVDLQSPAGSQDIQTTFPTPANLDVQAEAGGIFPEEDLDTTDWARETGLQEENHTSKKERSVSEAPHPAATVYKDIVPSSIAEEDTSAQNDEDFKTIEESATIVESSMELAAAQQSSRDSTNTLSVETSVPEQSGPSQPGATDMTAEDPAETTRELDPAKQELRDEVDASFSERPHDSEFSQPELMSKDVLTETTGQDEAIGIAPAFEKPSSPQPETVGNLDEALALPMGREQLQSTDVFTESNHQEAENVEEKSETPTSKKRNVENRQSLSSAEDVVEAPVPTSSVEKTINDVQDSSPTQASPAAIDLPTEPLGEQLLEPLEIHAQPLSSEAFHDDVPQQIQIDAQASTEEPAVVASTCTELDKHSPDTPAEEYPSSPREQTHVPEPDVSQVLVEGTAAISSEPQETEQKTDPSPVSAEEEYSITSKKSKKGKKRKGSKLVDEPVQSPVTAEPIDREHFDLAVHLPDQSGSSAGDDVQYSMLPSESKENAPVVQDAIQLDLDPARSPSPAHDGVGSADATEDRPLSAQQDVQPNASLLEGHKAHAPPTLASLDSATESGIVSVDKFALDASTEPHPESEASKSLEPDSIPDVTAQPSDFSQEPRAFPVQDKLPTEISSPELEPGSLEPQASQESVLEANIISKEQSVLSMEPKQSDIKQQKDFSKTLDEGEAALRELEAAKVREEEAEVARLQLKRKPSKKDKSRLKDLKAKAQQRAEQAEANASSSNTANDSEKSVLQSEAVEGSKPSETEPREATHIEEPVLCGQTDQIADTSDPKKYDPLFETVRSAVQGTEDSHLEDEGAQADFPSGSSRFEEGPEELARREAEAEIIRDEEDELSRLKIKRKPSKKDKNRIRALQAKAEERLQEAEKAAHRQAEEQAASTDETQEEAQLSADLDQDTMTGLNKEVPQRSSGSGDLKDNSQSPVDSIAELVPETSDATDVGNKVQPLEELPVLGQSDAQTTQDIDKPAVASTEHNRMNETKVDDIQVDNSHESLAHDQLAKSNVHDIDTTPPILDHTDGTNESHREDITEDVTGHPSSSPDKPKGFFGGWGLIAAAVGGANRATTLREDKQPERTEESQIQPRDHSFDNHDTTKHLDSPAGSIQDEFLQPNSQENNQPHAEVKDADFHEGVPPIDVEDHQSMHSEEAISNLEPSQLDEDTLTTQPDLAPEQIAATGVEPDSEWTKPSKKSKKGKKKRKGTMSGDNSENSGLATPLEVGESTGAQNPVEVANIGPLTPQNEDEFPTVGRENTSVQSTETLHVEQRASDIVESPRDGMAGNVASSALNEAPADLEKDPGQKSHDSGHLSTVDVTPYATAEEAGPGVSGSEHIAPLEELVVLPASLAQSVEAVPQIAEPVHSLAEHEAISVNQAPPQGIEHYETESRQFISADNPRPDAVATENTAFPNQNTAPAIEMSQDLPLRSVPNISVANERQQLQDNEISWVPDTEGGEKNQYENLAWSEPVSIGQIPTSEDVPGSSAPNNSQETSRYTQRSPQDEEVREARESHPQQDDWSPIISPKREEKASIFSWKPESIPRATLDEEPRKHHDFENFAGSSSDTNTVTQQVETVPWNGMLQEKSGHVPEPDLTVGHDDEGRLPLTNKNTEQLPASTSRQPGVLEGLSSDVTASEPAFEEKMEEYEDTAIATGEHVSDTELPLNEESAASQQPMTANRPSTLLQDPVPGEAVPTSEINSQVEHFSDPIIVSDKALVDQGKSVANERSVDLPLLDEHNQGIDLARTVEDGEDTRIVADEVSEPWPFEATHDSPTFTKSDLETKIEDGEDDMIAAGGKNNDEFVHPSYAQNDDEIDTQSMTQLTNEYLDIDQPVRRPQSPAPWGEEDYSTSLEPKEVELDQHFVRTSSLDPEEDNEIISPRQDDDVDTQHSAMRPQSPVPLNDDDSALVTLVEASHPRPPEAGSILNPDSDRDEDQPVEKASAKRSKKDKKNKKKASISQSLGLEPESSALAPENPRFEEAVNLDLSAEPQEAIDFNDAVPDKADKTVEPTMQEFDDWTPKKLTKKEKRKAKKGSISIPERQITAQSLEDTQTEPVSESPDQTPTKSADFGDVQQESPSRSEPVQLEVSVGIVEPPSESDLNRPPDVGGLPTDRPDTPSRDLPDDLVKAVKLQEGETPIDRQTEPSFSVPEEVAFTTAAAAVAVPVLTRQMSKKEKRRAKKASSSWEDDGLDTSQRPVSAVEDLQAQVAPIVASPTEESHLTRGDALDESSAKSQPEQVPATVESTVAAAEVIADDEWAAPLSRKKSKGKKKQGKQLSLDSVSGTQTPTTEEQPLRAGAEVQETPTPAGYMAGEIATQTADDLGAPGSPRPDPEDHSGTPSVAHLEAKSPATLGTDLQKIPSAAPSPDPWESEDYFKPKTAGSSPIGSPEESFGQLEVHPTFTRRPNTTSETRSQDERPLVGLGLIHRHSSIFREDDGHTPKLLTLTSDNASIESLAIEETSQPAPESMSENSSAHPQRRFPLSPRLSPRPAPEDPPKSPIPDEIKLSQRGSVAMLAQRFGGKHKKVPNFAGKPASVEDDLLDDPADWEGAEHKVVDGFRMEDDAGDFGAVEKASLEETSRPDMCPGQGSTPPAHSMGAKHGDDNVSATHSPPGPDAGRFTPELPGKAVRQEEVPLEPLVESPILGSQASSEIPSPGPHHTAHAPHSPLSAEESQQYRQATSIADAWDLIGSRQRRQDPPSARSASPSSDRGVDLENSVLLSIETEDGNSQGTFSPAIEFGRSVSRGLPPVQEEPLEEEAEAGKHATILTVATPDINRDSGFVTDSPKQAWPRRFDDAQQRDSGVHMRENRDRSPGLRSSRGGSPEPNRASRSSVEDGGARLDDKPKRSPLAKHERRLREDTPVLEAQEVPVTPEPQKPRSDGSRAHKYPDLGPGAKTGAILAGGTALLSAHQAAARSLSRPSAEGERSVSDSVAGNLSATTSPQADALPSQRRATSNSRISRAKTPEPLNLRPDSSPSLLRHSGTPPLRSRRTRSGDLRTLSQSSNRSLSDLGAGATASPSSPVSGRAPTPAAAANTPVPASSSSSSDLRRATTPAVAQTSTASPVANEGRLRSKDMADVYDGFGEGRLGSPRSPTRPHSMRRRQSMQVLDLENRVEQLMAENRALAEAKTQAELLSAKRVTSSLAERDNEIEALKQSLEFMRKEIHRLTEVNEGLNSAISQSAVQHQDQYRVLETQHAAATGELDNFRSQYGSHQQMIQEKDAEIRSLRDQLDATKEQVRELQRQILATNPADSDVLRIRDVDYFDHRCQQLCSHVQQWVLRFSKFSDMRTCRLTTELNDEKIIDRLDSAVLDGSNVDSYLNDRVRRRDVFMSVTMTMIWEFVFTRYLFGMDREQRQKLKALEKLLSEVGPPKAVRQWRAVTLTLLSKRDAFKDQREQDTEAVVQAVFQTLSLILPPPSNLEDQIQGQLRKVMREAVDLSIEMRTQRAEYMMLPPLQPEYDASGELAEPHPFNAQLMSERSGDKSNDDDLQAEGAIVRLVLFPLVVKKGDDEGVGDDEVVVCPAQVIIKKPRSSSRRSMRAPSSDAGGVSLLRGISPSTAPNRSNVSMAEAEYIEGGI